MGQDQAAIRVLERGGSYKGGSGFMRYEDENNPMEDEDDADEYEGYSVVDDEGNELSVSRKAAKKKQSESWDDGEIPEASPIPQNEQTVLIDNADVSDLDIGTELMLAFSVDSASLYHNGQKAGDLKPAFTAKLQETRKGMYVSCELLSTAPPVMVRLTFYDRAHKNTVKI